MAVLEDNQVKGNSLTRQRDVATDSKNHLRLKYQLEAMASEFKIVNSDERLTAKVEWTDKDRGRYVLTILKKNGPLKFGDVLGQVFPTKAGGDTANLFDAIWNRSLIDGMLDLPELEELVTGMVGRIGQAFGEHHYQDSLSRFTNNIAQINPSYEPMLPDDDTALY